MSVMPDETLFDHARNATEQVAPEQGVGPIPAPTCKTLRHQARKDPNTAGANPCRCTIPERVKDREIPCAFANWMEATAETLAKDAPIDLHMPSYATEADFNPAGPLEFMLSLKGLGSHYPGTMVSLPGFYALHPNPIDQGVLMLTALYTHAMDPARDLGLDHRVGYRAEHDVCRVERFFAAGFKERGQNQDELAYTANYINLRELVCRSQEDLEALYTKILGSKLTGSVQYHPSLENLTVH